MLQGSMERISMLYTLVELNRLAMAPLRFAAEAGRAALQSPGNPLRTTDYGKSLLALTDVFERTTRDYTKPAWHIHATSVNGRVIPVTPKTVDATPWCGLVHFAKDAEAMSVAKQKAPQPKMLIVAPLSGHYATLLRGTVEGFLPTHDVYITDWSDARMTPVYRGRFDLDDYIDHVRRMMTKVGPGAHVLAVCQPGPPVLAAIAMMSEEEDLSLPASMTFMGSPIDARRSPTVPNKLAEERKFSWFEENMIHTVPATYPGAFRRVYPGFVQLASFMNMNWQRHVDAQWSFFNHLIEGDDDSAEKHREFYDEYLAVLDLTEEFYLQTIKRVFQEHHLARGLYRYRGERLVKPACIRDVALMTVEGEKDDISGIGQTQAAHDLCTSIPKAMQCDYVQPDVGHYGVFNGSRFRDQIVPRVVNFTRQFDKPA
jgi:poly(3-hydroxybutyrate) depolymerase